MTESEFEMHRPKDYRSLSEFLAAHWDEPGTDLKEWRMDFDIEPSYWDGILFIAKAAGLCRICLLADGRTWAWEKDLGGPVGTVIPPHWTGP